MDESFEVSLVRFAKKFRLFRKQRGLTQEDVAKKTGVDVRQIRRYEHGEDWPTIPHMKVILETLEVPLWQLLDMDRETAERLFGVRQDLIPPTVELQVLLQAISDRFSNMQQQLQWLQKVSHKK